MKLWIVLEDGHGAHEPELLRSVWTSQLPAEAEVARLNAMPFVKVYAKEIEADAVPADGGWN